VPIGVADSAFRPISDAGRNDNENGPAGPVRSISILTACSIIRCWNRWVATLVGPAHAETTTRLDAIVGNGILRVGLTEDYRPFSFADASGRSASPAKLSPKRSQHIKGAFDFRRTPFRLMVTPFG
jgi:hypothetical protein